MATNSTTRVSRRRLEFDHKLNIVFLGDRSSGKSHVIPKFLNKDQDQYSHYFSAIGVAMEFKIIEIDGKKIKLVVMDSAGHDRFFTPSIPKAANCVIAVYSIYDQKSFTMVQKWLTNLSHYRKEFKKDKYPEYILLGNDYNEYTILEGMQRVITEREGRNFAVTVGAQYLEVNPTTGENIDEAFYLAARRVLHNSYWLSGMADVEEPKIRVSSHPGNNEQKGSSKPVAGSTGRGSHGEYTEWLYS